MDAYIDECRAKVVQIAEQVEAKCRDKQTRVRVAFVGYRDFDVPKDQQVVVHSFGTPAACRTFVEGVKARGGDDGPEDVAGGLRALLELPWESDKARKCARVCVFIADAPAHGVAYHKAGMRDVHEALAENERLEPLMQAIGDKKIDFYVLRNLSAEADAATEIMARKMQAGYNVSTKRRNPFGTLELKGANVANMLDTIVDAVTRSVDTYNN